MNTSLDKQNNLGDIDKKFNTQLAGVFRSINFQNIIDNYNKAIKEDKKNFSFFSWKGLKIITNATALAIKELPALIATYKHYKQGFFNDINNVTALLTDHDITSALSIKGKELGEISYEYLGINKDIIPQFINALKSDQDLQQDAVKIGQLIEPILRDDKVEEKSKADNQKILTQCLILLSRPSLASFRNLVIDSLSRPEFANKVYSLMTPVRGHSEDVKQKVINDVQEKNRDAIKSLLDTFGEYNVLKKFAHGVEMHPYFVQGVQEVINLATDSTQPVKDVMSIVKKVTEILGDSAMTEFRSSIKEALKTKKIQQVLADNIMATLAAPEQTGQVQVQPVEKRAVEGQAAHVVSAEIISANKQFGEKVIDALPIMLNALDNIGDLTPVVQSLGNGEPLPNWVGHVMQMVLNNKTFKEEIIKDPEKISNLLVASLRGPLRELSDSLQFDPEILDILKVLLKDPENSRKLFSDLEKVDIPGVMHTINDLLLSDKEVAKEMRKYLANKPEFTEKVNRFIANSVIEMQAKTSALLPEMLLEKEELANFKEVYAKWEVQMDKLTSLIASNSALISGKQISKDLGKIKEFLYTSDALILGEITEELKKAGQLTIDQQHTVNKVVEDFNKATNALKAPFTELLNKATPTVLATLEKHQKNLSEIFGSYNEKSFTIISANANGMSLEEKQATINQDLVVMKNVLVYLRDNQDLRNLLKDNQEVRTALERMFANRFAANGVAGYDLGWFKEKTGIDIAQVPVTILNKCDIFTLDDNFKYVEHLYNAFVKSEKVNMVMAGSQILYKAGIISSMLNIDTVKAAMNIIGSVAYDIGKAASTTAYNIGAQVGIKAHEIGIEDGLGKVSGIMQQAVEVIIDPLKSFVGKKKEEQEKFHDAIQQISDNEVQVERISSTLSDLIADDLFKHGKDGDRAEDTKLIKESLNKIIEELDQSTLNQLSKLKLEQMRQIVGKHDGRLNKWIKKMSNEQHRSIAQLYYSEATENTYIGLLTGGIKIKSDLLNNQEFQNKIKELLNDHEKILETCNKSRDSGICI